MEVLFLAACEMSVIDQRTNGLSLFNVIEEIAAPAFPIFMHRLSIVALLERGQDEPDIVENVTVSCAIGNQVIFSAPIAVNFQERSRLRTISDISGLLIPTPEILNVSLMRDVTPLASWKSSINLIGGGLQKYSPRQEQA